MTNYTVHDVASLAGVSIATVSRTFSRPDLVADKTRRRVLDAAEHLDFSVSRSAAALKSGRTYRIAYLLGGLLTEWFNAEVFAGLNSVFQPAGYDILPYSITSAQEREQFFRMLPIRKNADAVVIPSFGIGSAEIDDLKSVKIPIVGINPNTKYGLSLGVGIDDENAIKKTVQYLIALGHRSLVYIYTKSPSYMGFSAAKRVTAFCDSCKEAGDTIACSLVEVPQGDDCLDDTVDRILSIKPRASAICCQADSLAVPLIAKLMRRGVRIPNDMSIIGFDDSKYAKDIRLTTIRQRPFEMASLAAKETLELLQGNTVNCKFRVFDTPLILRSTVADYTKR